MSEINHEELNKICDKIFRRGMGILAADESTETAGKRLASIGLENTIENRATFRDILINTLGVEKYMSGIILYPETLFQESSDGRKFSEILNEKNIAIGVKVDLGTYDFPGFPNEKLTQGIDGLRDRLKEYKQEGCEFTKFRCVFTIGESIPTIESIHLNSITLALYARLVQEEGMVPIVEPEVIYDGDHSIEQSREVTQKVVDHLFYEMERLRVDIPHVILKTSMVLAGKSLVNQSEPEDVARETVNMLLEAVPHECKGVVFLSGGQTPEQAFSNFSAIADLEPLPFELAFSFARALQDSVLSTWQGKEENIPASREAFLKILAHACEADQGRYILR